MSAPAPVDEARQEGRHAERPAPSAMLRTGLQRYAILIVFAALIVGFGIALPGTFLSVPTLALMRILYLRIRKARTAAQLA